MVQGLTCHALRVGVCCEVAPVGFGRQQPDQALTLGGAARWCHVARGHAEAMALYASHGLHLPRSGIMALGAVGLLTDAAADRLHEPPSGRHRSHRQRHAAAVGCAGSEQLPPRCVTPGRAP